MWIATEHIIIANLLYNTYVYSKLITFYYTRSYVLFLGKVNKRSATYVWKFKEMSCILADDVTTVGGCCIGSKNSDDFVHYTD